MSRPLFHKLKRVLQGSRLGPSLGERLSSWIGLREAPVLPEVTRHYLRRSNPRLLELEALYAGAQPSDRSTWKALPRRIDLAAFRGEGYYLSQRAYATTRMNYLATAVHVEAVDDWGLLYSLPEDDLFGAITYPALKGVLLSRDLLDSVLEITFLRKHLALDRKGRYVVLDIGAGYGRFAHRFASVFPSSFVHCTDAVAESTFLCEFYIEFRQFRNRAAPLLLNNLEALSNQHVDFAMNVHSWSECPLVAIRFWLDFLAGLPVKFLFVVPHESRFLTTETDGTRVSFLPEIERHGYRMIVNGSKFGDSRLLVAHGIFNAPYALFELK